MEARLLPDAPLNASFEPPAAIEEPKADSVGDGIATGAVLGGLAGTVVMAVLLRRCDDGCGMYLYGTAIGAGAGAVLGWAIDDARKSSDRRVSVGASVAPKRQSVRVAVRF